MHLISKTIFLDFLNCPKNVWLKLNEPKLLDKFVLSEFEKHLMEQGNEVESYARNLFPGGIEIVGTGEEACQETIRLMTAKIPALFQATFIVDGFIARNDALVYDESGKKWNLYEVKGSNSLKDDGVDHDHIDDLTFQASVLRRANIPVGKYFLVHLNKDYVRNGDLSIKELFLIEDETEKVLSSLQDIENKMEVAKDYLSKEKEPLGGCECIYKSRRNHCTTYQHSNPETPSYSVHDISRIHKKKLEGFVEGGIFELKDIPDEAELSEIQWNQVKAHTSGRTTINNEAICDELKKLTFPLYFLDYETFAPAIPIFNGYKPYQRIPFQFSLHILENPTAEIKHIEYLHKEHSDPSEKVAELLNENIGPKGTIIAWNVSFERGVNTELGNRVPSHKIALERMNTLLYDLRNIFRKQHYVHPEFKGSTSLKKVLPALTGMNYKELNIGDGGQASDAWWKMVSPATPAEESSKIYKDLLDYCGLDTISMLEIWKHLVEKTS